MAYLSFDDGLKDITLLRAERDRVTFHQHLNEALSTRRHPGSGGRENWIAFFFRDQLIRHRQRCVLLLLMEPANTTIELLVRQGGERQVLAHPPFSFVYRSSDWAAPAELVD